MATTQYGSSATFRVSAQFALKNGLNVETLTGTFTLTKQSASFQKLDPGGASRNVVLPAIDPAYGPFLIENTADAAENLVVKAPDGTTTIATLARGEAAWLMVDTDGTDAWVAVDQHGTTGDAGLVGDTVSELTAAAGVTVDGCLIKDGRAGGLATGQMFGSSEQTGTGASQTIAHGFGSTPTLIWITVTEDPAGTGFDVAEGTHDVTNIVVTVTTGVKFRAYAIK